MNPRFQIIGSSNEVEVTSGKISHAVGRKRYELTNHLGNVLIVISDRRIAADNVGYEASPTGTYSPAVGTPGLYHAFISGTTTYIQTTGTDGIIDYYTAEIISSSEYSAFGVQLQDWGYQSEDYRYAFNGKEKENEYFEGAYDFGARILDVRLGKWLSVDAFVKDFPMLSPYQFAANSPIFLIDPDGNTIIPTGEGNNTPEISKAMLEGYFRTAFGSAMATALVSSYTNNGYGDFRGNSEQKKAFENSFNAALSQMNNDYLKTLAIGVFEAICSNEPTYFIGYAGDAGIGTCPGNRQPGTCDRNIINTGKGDFSTCVPTVNGNPSLCSLTNGVDELYAGKSGPSGNTLATSALVAVSDAGYINMGTPDAPIMGDVSNPNMTGRDPQYGMSINVVTQIAASGRCLSKDLVRIGSKPIIGTNAQSDAASTSQTFFNNVANNLRAMLQGQPARMSRSERRTMRDEDNGGASYAPNRRD